MPKPEKPDYSFILPLFLTFILIQAAGMYIGNKQIQAMQEIGEEPIEGAEMGAFLFLEILVVTGIILVIIKYIRKYLKAIIMIPMAVWTMFFFWYMFDGIIPDPHGLILAGLISLAIITLAVIKKDMLSRNILITTGICWAGAILGSMLGFYPILLFEILLTIYDYIAVFKTKHMVTMAKEIVTQQIPATMVIPTKNHVYYLGGGDLVMPLLINVSVLRDFGLTASLFTLIGACIGMVGIFVYMAGKEKNPLPALPPIVVSSLFALMIYLILLNIGIL
ncbi:hypothetical protein K8R43_06520 [archaeon]|nr:hypothetical protein [archaeon]